MERKWVGDSVLTVGDDGANSFVPFKGVDITEVFLLIQFIILFPHLFRQTLGAVMSFAVKRGTCSFSLIEQRRILEFKPFFVLEETRTRAEEHSHGTNSASHVSNDTTMLVWVDAHPI